MLCDGVIWYHALFAKADLAKAHEGDHVLAFFVFGFFGYVAVLLWHAMNDD